MDSHFYSFTVGERSAMVREAFEKSQPLLIRWAELPADFGDRWRGRAMKAAEWLSGAGSVADLGCGTMSLERCLNSQQHYLPIDLAPRDHRTVVLDLNQQSDLDRLPNADACALLGLIEYSYVPTRLVDALRLHYRQVVVSYNVRLESDDVEHRLANGWINHFNFDEFTTLFHGRGFILDKALRHDDDRQEFIFNFFSEREL